MVFLFFVVFSLWHDKQNHIFRHYLCAIDCQRHSCWAYLGRRNELHVLAAHTQHQWFWWCDPFFGFWWLNCNKRRRRTIFISISMAFLHHHLIMLSKLSLTIFVFTDSNVWFFYSLIFAAAGYRVLRVPLQWHHSLLQRAIAASKGQSIGPILWCYTDSVRKGFGKKTEQFINDEQVKTIFFLPNYSSSPKDPMFTSHANMGRMNVTATKCTPAPWNTFRCDICSWVLISIRECLMLNIRCFSFYRSTLTRTSTHAKVWVLNLSPACYDWERTSKMLRSHTANALNNTRSRTSMWSSNAWTPPKAASYCNAMAKQP